MKHASPHLLIDATPLQSEHRVRGVGAYVRALIGALEALPGTAPHYLISSLPPGEVPGLPYERLHRMWRPHQPAQVYWLYNEVMLRAALGRLRPNVFFASDFNGLLPNPAGITVAVLHDLSVLKVEAKVGSSLSEKLSDWRWQVYYRKLKLADSIITISDSVKEDAVTLLGLEPARLRTVHHGIDLARYQPTMGRGAFAGREPYFVHVGARNPNKNQARLLQAFAKISPAFPELWLYFGGPWREGDLAWLEREKAWLGLTRVKHLGYVAAEDLPSLYGNAWGFTFPSLEEGFGLPVLEAMACGAPVLTSNRSSLPEVAGEAALLVDPADADALAAGLARLARDAEVRDALRAAGYARAQQFSWRRTAETTLEVIEAALATKLGGALEPRLQS